MDTQFNFVLALPEIVMAVLASCLLLLDVTVKSKNASLSYHFALLSLMVLMALQLFQLHQGVQGVTFYGMYVADPLSHLFKVFCYMTVIATMIYGRQYLIDREMIRGGEIYAMILLATLGQMVMISASSMLTIYLGLELMSLSLYAMIAIRREDRPSLESAMKYFVLGSLASGFLLYGISLLYGATGHIDLFGVMQGVKGLIATHSPAQLTVLLATVFVVCGLAFKLGLVPFHMWIPDVYQGSPSAITIILSTAPKLAAIVMVMRLLVSGLGELAHQWQMMLMILVVLSLFIGNITAIVQTNFKRMLAYSTISQVGFVAIGLISGSPFDTSGYGASLFYMVIYVLTTLGTFGMILLLSHKGFECENIADLAGLNQRNPLAAFVLLLLMFSLAGVPPLAGFDAKLSVLQAAVSAGHVGLAIFAVIMSLIGAFYYLRVVKVMYFDAPAEDAPSLSLANSFQSGVMSVNALLVILFGLLPGSLLAICVQAINNSLTF